MFWIEFAKWFFYQIINSITNTIMYRIVSISQCFPRTQSDSLGDIINKKKNNLIHIHPPIYLSKITKSKSNLSLLFSLNQNRNWFINSEIQINNDTDLSEDRKKLLKRYLMFFQAVSH